MGTTSAKPRSCSSLPNLHTNTPTTIAILVPTVFPPVATTCSSRSSARCGTHLDLGAISEPLRSGSLTLGCFATSLAWHLWSLLHCGLGLSDVFGDSSDTTAAPLWPDLLDTSSPVPSFVRLQYDRVIYHNDPVVFACELLVRNIIRIIPVVQDKSYLVMIII